jgi:hypothetical protein
MKCKDFRPFRFLHFSMSKNKVSKSKVPKRQVKKRKRVFVDDSDSKWKQLRWNSCLLGSYHKEEGVDDGEREMEFVSNARSQIDVVQEPLEKQARKSFKDVKQADEWLQTYVKIVRDTFGPMDVPEPEDVDFVYDVDDSEDSEPSESEDSDDSSESSNEADNPETKVTKVKVKNESDDAKGMKPSKSKKSESDKTSELRPSPKKDVKEGTEEGQNTGTEEGQNTACVCPPWVQTLEAIRTL